MPDAASVLRFAIGAGGVRFGIGELRALGDEARARGLARVLLVTDVHVAAAGVPEPARRSLAAAGVWSETLTLPAGEPVDTVVVDAADAARAGAFDGVVAIGGGAVIDSAKVLALTLASGLPPIEHANPPFGAGAPPSGMPLPLIAVPTTAGSGSDVSAVAVLELSELGVKTAISHPALRPVLAIADPAVTIGAPPAATRAAGLDVLAHAVESLTARPATDPARAEQPPAVYAGANPYSDALCLAALPLLARGLPAAVADGADLGARADVLHAATLANLGAAVAGSHAGHAAAYAIASVAPGAAHGDLVGALLPGLVGALPASCAPVCARAAAGLGAPGLAEGIEHLLARVGAESLRVVADPAGLASAAATQSRLMSNAPEGLDERALERVLASVTTTATQEAAAR